MRHNSRKNVLVIVGTRPNFIKVTRFKAIALQFPDMNLKIVHTGQHSNANMSDIFFEQFSLSPDYFLNVEGGNPAGQIGNIMLKLESLVNANGKPDVMVVVGDVNSTLAAALTAKKLNIPLAHVESGLRSFDRSMPEEFNRIVTDQISNLHFVTEEAGLQNLEKERTPPHGIHFVGNTMIDTLVHFEQEIDRSNVLESHNLTEKNFVLITMHRPATVDVKEGLEKLISLMERISKDMKIVFPVHHRTSSFLKQYNLMEKLEHNNGVVMIPPLGYFDFQKLVKCCRFIITDSGGIQEESTFLGVPCLTLRNNTERPVTCKLGTNSLVRFETSEILTYSESILNGSYKKGNIPPLWDGHATERIFSVLNKDS